MKTRRESATSMANMDSCHRTSTSLREKNGDSVDTCCCYWILWKFEWTNPLRIIMDSGFRGLISSFPMTISRVDHKKTKQIGKRQDKTALCIWVPNHYKNLGGSGPYFWLHFWAESARKISIPSVMSMMRYMFNIAQVLENLLHF